VANNTLVNEKEDEGTRQSSPRVDHEDAGCHEEVERGKMTACSEDTPAFMLAWEPYDALAVVAGGE
jgi:hypothetical protein